MSKVLFFSTALAIALGSTSLASAQYGAQYGVSSACCGGCYGVQSYQRYSYQPAGATAVQGVAPSQSTVVSPGAAPVYVQPQASFVQPQSYQRYSYQPTARTYNYSAAPRKQPWEYAKGERQRYLP